MKKSEKIPAQSQPAARLGGVGVESPQGDRIAQLESMIESSPRIQSHSQLAAMTASSPPMAAQRKKINGLFGTVQRAEAPSRPNHTGLPDQLKSGIENLSGMSMDNVKVHYNSSQPAQLNALAYAQGSDIHVAPGQEQHLPHEAWHVVQQAQGRVAPTMQMKEGIPVNDDKGLEHEADVMGAKAATGVVQAAGGGQEARPAPAAACSSHASLQFTMADLHNRQKTLKEQAFHDGNDYTTVGFEVDLLNTSEGGPLQGLSHLVLGKSTSNYGLLNIPYQLETDAGNIVELVSPPYLIKTDEKGVLDKQDLKDTMNDLKDGFDKTKSDVGGGEKKAVDAFGFINSGFNINLTHQEVSFAAGDEHDHDDGVINDTHMSTRMNLNKTRTFVDGGAEYQKDALKLKRGPNFNPQLNVFTTIKGYRELDEATESRLDDNFQFNRKEAEGVLAAKRTFMESLAGRLSNGKYQPVLAQLEHTLLVLEGRRDALLAQRAQQRRAFEDKSLQNVDQDKFNKDSGDASFVKDTGGVWLKTDISNFIKKALNYNYADITETGLAILANCGRWTNVIDLGSISDGSDGWAVRLNRLGMELVRFGQAKGVDGKFDTLDTINDQNKNSWNSQTYSLSKTVLGIRHDTMLKEDLVTACQKALIDTGKNYNEDPKVLVELRNIGIDGSERTKDELEAKIDAFIDKWTTAAGG